ncbi:hypothetical protein ACFLWI_04705 [Chloroflexota bacterium]
MPVTEFKHNLIKVCKQQYRNPIYLAKEWRRALDNAEYASSAALARHLKVSRVRVTQIMNLLKLSPEAIRLISSMGDPIRYPVVTERKLRPLLGSSIKQQIAQAKIILSKVMHNQM